MTQTSRFWDGALIGDAGPYSSTEMSKVLGALVGGAHTKPDAGVLVGSGAAPNLGLHVAATTPNSKAVELWPGAALVHGTYYENDATMTLPLADNGTAFTRIDTIALEKDWATQTVRAVVLQGTPAASPSPVALVQTDGVLWQVPLADVTLAAGFASVGVSVIRLRHVYLPVSDGAYFLDCLNNSGQTLQRGHVVVWDTTAERAVTVTTTEEASDVAGVWQEQTPAGAYGRVMLAGVSPVLLASAAASVGQLLYTSTTAGKARLGRNSANRNKARGWPLGRTLMSGALGEQNTCICAINVLHPAYVPAIGKFESLGVGFQTTSTSFVNVTGAAVTVTIKSTAVKVWLTATGRAFAGGEVIAFGLSTSLGDYLGDLFISGQSADLLITGLTAGANTLQLRVRNAGNSNNIQVDKVFMLIEEVVE